MPMIIVTKSAKPVNGSSLLEPEDGAEGVAAATVAVGGAFAGFEAVAPSAPTLFGVFARAACLRAVAFFAACLVCGALTTGFPLTPVFAFAGGAAAGGVAGGGMAAGGVAGGG